MDIRLTLSGTMPLLMHNIRLADPFDPLTQELRHLTGKRDKTEDDQRDIARLEHGGGLYFDDTIGPYIPGENIWRMVYDAAGRTKRLAGKKVKEGFFVSSDINPLRYDGPRTVDGLWTDKSFVFTRIATVQRRRVQRCRPIFRHWQTEATAVLDPNILDLSDIERFIETAGLLIGLGDWRPRYGRFVGSVQRG